MWVQPQRHSTGRWVREGVVLRFFEQIAKQTGEGQIQPIEILKKHTVLKTFQDV